MLTNAWFIARKDLQYTLRAPETLLWLFIMPVVFIYFIGTITSGFGSRRISKDRLAVRSHADAGFLADELMRRLEANDFDIVRTDTDEQFQSSSRRLTIPAEFTRDALAGKRTAVAFSRKEAGLMNQYDQIRVGRAVYTVLADLIASVANGATPDADSFRRLKETPRTLQLEVQPGGKRRQIPTGFEQAVPGTLVLFTMILLLTSGTVTVVNERRLGVLRRLASTPISRNAVVFGKWLSRMALGVVQIGFAMFAGSILFGMVWGPDLPMIVLVLIGWGGLCASLALLLGSLLDTEGQAIGIGVVSGNVLAALGGCMWPIEITPAWLQTVSILLPTGWTMDAMHRLVSFQSGAASAVPHTIALFSAALAVGWLAGRHFRFQ